MLLAGYLPEENGPEDKKPARVPADGNGKLRDLAECAGERYETDPEWMQTAYLVCCTMTEEQRARLNRIVREMMGIAPGSK